VSGALARPLALLALLALLAPLLGCPGATWGEAAREAAAAVEVRPEGATVDPSALVRAGELALLVDADRDRAERHLRAALARLPAADPAARRALLALIHLAALDDRLGPPGELARQLGGALEAEQDPHAATLLAYGAVHLLGRSPSAHAPDGPLVAGLQRVAGRPGAAWEPARAEATRQLVTAAQLAGGPAAAVAAAERAGVLLDWRVSAPWGRAPGLDLWRELGPERRPLRAHEATGAGWDLAPRRTGVARFSDGEVAFFDLEPDAGVGFAETTVGVSGGELVLRLETNRSARVFANGVEVLAVDRFASPSPWEHAAGLRVGSGALRLTVKFASADARGFFRARLLGRDGPAPLDRRSGAGEASASVALVAVPYDAIATPSGAVAPGDGAAAVRALVALDAASARPRRAYPAVAALLAALRGSLPDYPGLALAEGRLATLDPDLIATQQRRAARTAAERLLARWPDSAAAHLLLARLEAEDERLDVALTHLRAALAAAPEHLPAQLALLRHLQARGWEAEVLERAEALASRAAEHLEAGLAAAEAFRALGRVERARRTVDEVEGAFPGAGVGLAAELDADAGDHRARAEALTAMWRHEPERLPVLREAVAAWRAHGDVERAVALLDALAEARPDDPWAKAERARVALGAGDLVAGERLAAEVAAAHPGLASMASLAAWLAGEPEGFDVIDDGEEVVAAWLAGDAEARAAVAGFPIVNLLDRQVIAVRADGTTTELAHRVRLVQTRSGADSLGDVRPPQGARILAIRTIKADGRVLWPEITPGKAELSLPELQIGDAVETAWVSRGQVRPQEGGYLTSFVFAGWGVPTVARRIEVHVAPGLALSWRAFGGAPGPSSAGDEPRDPGRAAPTHHPEEAPARAGSRGPGCVPQRLDGAPDGVSAPLGPRCEAHPTARVHRWDLRDLPAIPPEPVAAGARTFFPFVDVMVWPEAEPAALPAAWRAIAEAHADRVARLGRPGPRAESVAATLTPRGSPLARARAAYRWVMEHVHDSERFVGFDVSAEVTLEEGRGSRALALLALARALALDAELLLCAPRQDGPALDEAEPTPNVNRFFYPIVRVPHARGALALDVVRPFLAPGVVPDELEGARCLAPVAATAGGDAFVTLPSPPRADTPPDFDFEVRLALDATGAALGVLEATARGPRVSGLRRAWLDANDSQRHMLWQQWAATLLPGVRVEADAAEDVDAAERPMRWRLDLSVPRFARASPEGLVVERVMKPLLGADLGSVPELEQLVAVSARRTPLRTFPHAERARVVLLAPEGMTWAAVPETIARALGPHHLSQRVRVSGRELEVVRETRLAAGRVEPEGYAAFRAALEEVARAYAGGALAGAGALAEAGAHRAGAPYGDRPD